MTEPVWHCSDHGVYAAADSCPACGAPGERLLGGSRRRQLSKYLSGALRHFPDDAGVSLDAAGWASWDAVVESVESQYDWAGARAVEAVVATDPKGRFERRVGEGGDRIRAAYGHSVDVDLDSNSDRGAVTGDTDVPGTLYHGTAPRHLDAIREEGLRPMGRQFVHLSGSQESARAVGQRHTADPVVFAVDVRGLAAAGFDVRKRGHDTYTVERVPPRFLISPPNV
jgi:putative RNA 2'-phosphotransferase